MYRNGAAYIFQRRDDTRDLYFLGASGGPASPVDLGLFQCVLDTPRIS